MQWDSAIRMSPWQVMFLLKDELQAKNDARARNRRAAGLSVEDAKVCFLEEMKRLRRAYTGTDNRDEL